MDICSRRHPILATMALRLIVINERYRRDCAVVPNQLLNSSDNVAFQPNHVRVHMSADLSLDTGLYLHHVEHTGWISCCQSAVLWTLLKYSWIRQRLGAWKVALWLTVLLHCLENLVTWKLKTTIASEEYCSVGDNGSLL